MQNMHAALFSERNLKQYAKLKHTFMSCVLGNSTSRNYLSSPKTKLTDPLHSISKTKKDVCGPNDIYLTCSFYLSMLEISVDILYRVESVIDI